MCWHKSICYEGECRHQCNAYPILKNRGCICDKSIFCDHQQVCQDGACVARPPTCDTATFVTGDPGCSCVINNNGAICQDQQICQHVDNKAICMETCTTDVIIEAEYCYCSLTSSACPRDAICNSGLSQCISKCPEFPGVNQESQDCHCDNSLCETQQVCGSQGCGVMCPDMPQKAGSAGCYCGSTWCNEDEMCSIENSIGTSQFIDILIFLSVYFCIIQELAIQMWSTVQPYIQQLMILSATVLKLKNCVLRVKYATL